MKIEKLKKIINMLPEQEPFCSEAQFQLKLAIELSKHFDVVDVEHPFKIKWVSENKEKDIHLDILFGPKNEKIGIELKYKTKSIIGQDSNLKNQSAHDEGRYDFWADVSRLEKLKENKEINQGFAIFLTNDPAYYNYPKKIKAMDVKFRIHDTQKTNGSLNWLRESASHSTSFRQYPINLTGNYTLSWNPFCEDKDSKFNGSGFNYLVVEV
jgi:hypothetical protein